MDSTTTEHVSANALEAFSNGRYLLGGEFNWDAARDYFAQAESLGHPHAKAVIEWLDVLESEEPEDLAAYHPALNVPELLMTSGFLLEDEEVFESPEADIASRRNSEYVWLCFNHDEGARPNVLIDLFQKLESGYFSRDFIDGITIKHSIQAGIDLGIEFAAQLARELGFELADDEPTRHAEPDPSNPLCPKCFQRSIPIVYGMVLPPAEGEPEFHIGGCLVDGSNPSWHCKNCDKDF